MKRRGPLAVVAAGAATALAVTFATAGPARSATSPGAGARSPVAQDIVPAGLRGARVTGTTAASTRERISFVLKAQKLTQLENNAETGMPHGFLSTSEFANTYGQSASTVANLQNYLAQYGIHSSAYSDRLDVSATGTAAQFDQALGVSQRNYFVPAAGAAGSQQAIAAQNIHGVTGQPTLPGSIAKSVLSILGLTSYSPFTTNLVHTPKTASGVTVHATVNNSQTPVDFANNYGLDPLYAKGATGAGQTIGIVTLAAVNPWAPMYFWRHDLGLKVPDGKISVTNVDGGPGAPSLFAGSDETALDVEQSGGIAPQAHVDVYQAPNTDPGFADAFYDAASQNTAGSVSTSWGESETYIAATVAAHQESPAYVQVFNQAFLELDAQGQANFVAAGDNGAYDAADDIGTKNLSVDNPGDSPFTTDAGGTTLSGKVSVSGPDGTSVATIPAQRAWGWDYMWPFYKDFGFTSKVSFAESEQGGMGGGGGGFSVDAPTPLYQQSTSGTRSYSAVQYLTPTDYTDVDGLSLPVKWKFNPHPTVITGTGSGRAVPDVSANADPFTGYEIFDPEYKDPGHLEGDWGGTSFVAPQFNGATAVIDSYIGGRVGFWNPAIYQFANQPGSPFTPMDTAGTSNDNLYYSGTPGTTFNEGSGLGYPDFSRLAEDFALNR
ncbi:MAG TPA: S53 family peptidase [Streptosporangiaceae bacterium]|jgi:subtilase family serine protease